MRTTPVILSKAAADHVVEGPAFCPHHHEPGCPILSSLTAKGGKPQSLIANL